VNKFEQFFTAFNTSDGDTGSDKRMRIAANGIVGMGAHEPQRILHEKDVFNQSSTLPRRNLLKTAGIWFDNVINKLQGFEWRCLAELLVNSLSKFQ
jgi:hypothetical protein